ncbi:hypothetical protein ADEAN_000109900 [Angomonas deanei]|uniref:Uncharacterized protein n=1 Tax=Angomonas deanei TaxID=59799 RepID=A0A7G2C1Z0_9TRYP|nr:hypothetical protein ADEAN_000109900 [Angomonas deanei]
MEYDYDMTGLEVEHKSTSNGNKNNKKTASFTSKNGKSNNSHTNGRRSSKDAAGGSHLPPLNTPKKKSSKEYSMIDVYQDNDQSAAGSVYNGATGGSSFFVTDQNKKKNSLYSMQSSMYGGQQAGSTRRGSRPRNTSLYGQHTSAVFTSEEVTNGYHQSKRSSFPSAYGGVSSYLKPEGGQTQSFVENTLYKGAPQASTYQSRAPTKPDGDRSNRSSPKKGKSSNGKTNPRREEFGDSSFFVPQTAPAPYESFMQADDRKASNYHGSSPKPDAARGTKEFESFYGQHLAPTAAAEEEDDDDLTTATDDTASTTSTLPLPVGEMDTMQMRQVTTTDAEGHLVQYYVDQEGNYYYYVQEDDLERYQRALAAAAAAATPAPTPQVIHLEVGPGAYYKNKLRLAEAQFGYSLTSAAWVRSPDWKALEVVDYKEKKRATDSEYRRRKKAKAMKEEFYILEERPRRRRHADHKATRRRQEDRSQRSSGRSSSSSGKGGIRNIFGRKKKK